MSPPSPHGYDHHIPSPSPSPAPPPVPTKTRHAPKRKRFKSPVRKLSPLPTVPKVPPPRPYDLSIEENEAVAKKELYEHFHKEKPPVPAPYTEKQKAYALNFLNTPSQYDLHEKKDDYTRTLARVIEKKDTAKKDSASTGKSSTTSVAGKKSSSTSAPLKAKQATTISTKRKKVPQLGEQTKQSIPPLKVLDVPSVYQGHGGIDMEETLKLAAQMGYTMEELLGSQDGALPIADIAPKFVYGADLVSKERLHQLPTHMRKLHQWYLDACKVDQRYIVANIPEEYYF
nr:uncharacterized protein LOC127297680 [Lolium perenne]